MPHVVVHVMPKPEILDPQGKAVHAALARMGYAGVTGVRQGKRFELEVEEPLTQAQLERIYDLAEKLLSNPVIEDFEVSILEPGQGVEADADMDVMW